jgi:hypothetical protein
MDFQTDMREEILDEWDDLYYYVRRKKNDKVKEIIKSKEPFDGKANMRPCGDKILHILAELGSVELFDWVVTEYNVFPLQVNNAMENPLIIACREGKMEMVQHIIEKYQQHSEFEIDHKNLDGWTAFMFASVNGYSSIAEYLHKTAFASINIKDKM